MAPFEKIHQETAEQPKLTREKAVENEKERLGFLSRLGRKAKLGVGMMILGTFLAWQAADVEKAHAGAGGGGSSISVEDMGKKWGAEVEGVGKKYGGEMDEMRQRNERDMGRIQQEYGGGSLQKPQEAPLRGQRQTYEQKKQREQIAQSFLKELAGMASNPKTIERYKNPAQRMIMVMEGARTMIHAYAQEHNVSVKDALQELNMNSSIFPPDAFESNAGLKAFDEMFRQYWGLK